MIKALNQNDFARLNEEVTLMKYSKWKNDNFYKQDKFDAFFQQGELLNETPDVCIEESEKQFIQQIINGLNEKGYKVEGNSELNPSFKKSLVQYQKDNGFDNHFLYDNQDICLLYTSPSPRDLSTSRMPSSA